MAEAEQYDLVIVGAGFAGMYMLHRAREMGLSARVYERGSGVGGTWYWNRYPGARCDVESMEYSYQFSKDLQQEWHWSERYSPQGEILKYANHVADRFDLRRDIQFDTSVRSAHYLEDGGDWQVTTDAGEVVRARFVVMATGCLSSANIPDFKGLGSFHGGVYHTGNWPHEGVDFAGKRVGIIGTGSSAIQSIPIIAREAEHLTVFQRTPNFSVPAGNQPLAAELEREIKADYAGFRARNRAVPTGFGARYADYEDSALAVDEDTRRQRLEEHWQLGGLLFLRAFADLGLDREANDTAAEFIRDKIREVVKDPATAELLCPDNVVGCKRLCADTDYFATFNRPNVALVDVSKNPVEEITPRGLKTGGVEYEFDCLICATGFDAMTGALLAVDIRGRDGRKLKDKWAEGPRTYLGLNVAGFPNLFTITGPGSPSVLSNMIQSIEQHVEFIADAIGYMDAHQHRTIEAQPEAEDAWVGLVNAIADMTLYPTCNSWYLGANVPGKPRVFMPYLGFPSYVEKCEDVVAKGYDGFKLAS